jgi:hypothetical protein
LQIKSTFYYLSEDGNIYELSAMESAQEEEQSHPCVPKVAGPGSLEQFATFNDRMEIGRV